MSRLRHLTAARAARPFRGTAAAISATAAMLLVLSGVMSLAPAKDKYAKEAWWAPGQGGVMGAAVEYPDGSGALGLLNASGAMPTDHHPFFTPLGSNGRACVSCHQPSNGMSLSVATIQRRWIQTKGHDPIFAAIDGSNCPSLPQNVRASHSLLLERGLFRVAEPWPPKSVKPEFKIEVVRDPTGCNTSAVYGLNSANPTVSVFRRPRMAANLKYVTSPGRPFNSKNIAMAMPVDPDTGKYASLNFMADARDLSLKAQAIEAVATHEQGPQPSAEQLKQIVDFESQVYVAQARDPQGRPLAYRGGPAALGPRAMRDGKPGVLGYYLENPVFHSFAAWERAAPGETRQQRAFRASVARGANIFFLRPLWIRDAQYINTVGLGNPSKGSCATCHTAQMTGQDLSAGWMDLGTVNRPWADDSPDLPLFKITCDPSAPPHTFLGRVIYTQDPGRALPRCGFDREAAVPRSGGAGAVFLQRVGQILERSRELL